MSVDDNSGFSQVPLSFRVDVELSFENFYWPEETAWLAALAELAEGPEPQWIYLCGQSGCGVSHLLQAVAAAADRAGESCIYIDLEIAAGSAPEDVLENIEQVALVCLDNIDKVAGRPAWEQALFSLLDQLRVAGRSRLLLGSHAVVNEMPVALADLRSRLAWCAVFQVPELEDGEKAALLAFRAERLGLELRQEVAEFLLNRCSRSLPELMQTLQRLDRAALVSQRRLTIPWIKQELGV